MAANDSFDKAKAELEEFMKNFGPITAEEAEELIYYSLNDLVDICHGASVKAGWWNDVPDELLVYVVPTKLALVHSEVSEALEGYRKDQMDDHLPERKMVEVELADALIRIFDLAGKLKLDLGGAVRDKMAYNAKRADHKLENRAKEGGKKF